MEAVKPRFLSSAIDVLMSWGLADPGGTAFLRASSRPETADDVPVRAAPTCKPSDPELTPNHSPLELEDSRPLSCGPSHPRAGTRQLGMAHVSQPPEVRHASQSCLLCSFHRNLNTGSRYIFSSLPPPPDRPLYPLRPGNCEYKPFLLNTVTSCLRVSPCLIQTHPRHPMKTELMLH